MAAHRCDQLPELTREDLDKLTEALKDEDFRKLLIEYCEEVQNPDNQKLYRKEFTQYEKERGYLVTFVNVQPGYVIKSSVDGDKKAFLNVCSSEQVEPPQFNRSDPRGINWTLPYLLAPARDDYDKSKQRCVVYDVIFHTNTLKLSLKNHHFKKLLNKTAYEGVQSNHHIKLDIKNLKYPKLAHKGVVVPLIIRKPDPNFNQVDTQNPTLLEQLYPQTIHDTKTPTESINITTESNPEYTTPKYTIKQSRNIDMKEYTYESDAKQLSATPNTLIVEVNLPLLSNTSDVSLDVQNKSFKLQSETQSRYKLDLNLPYKVDGDSGKAQFDLSRRVLIVTLPVIPPTWKVSREDSGVESDSNSNEDNSNSIDTEPGIEVISESETYRTSASVEDKFLDPTLSYVLPPYVINVFDHLLILTLDVKNVDPDSLIMEQHPQNDGIRMKFNSIGAGLFPIHHALNLKLPSSKCGKPVSEVWDNNVILQLEIIETQSMDHFYIGSIDSMTKYDLETPIIISEGPKSPLLRENFLQDDVYYKLPLYTFNVLDNVIAFTFHVERVQSESFQSESFLNDHGKRIKFNSIESDGSRSHYTLFLKFPDRFIFRMSFDAWENNTVMTLESDSMPDYFYVGISEDDMKKELIGDLSDEFSILKIEDNLKHAIEVTAKGTNEMNISLHKHPDTDFIIPKPNKENYNNSICSSSSSFKGILKFRNPLLGRSLSESNVDFMEYNVSPSYSISSADYIPEEPSSLKKTVRFSNVISKQTYRTNSSILGQKSKNQRKKRNKKRAQERRSSEGDNNDMCLLEVGSHEDVFLDDNVSFENHRLNSKKERRDSGLVETDDGDSDKCDSEKCNKKYEKEKHSSQILREKNKGKYQEVNFKNDLIFDLDM